jgi:hypothetical protein
LSRSSRKSLKSGHGHGQGPEEVTDTVEGGGLEGPQQSEESSTLGDGDVNVLTTAPSELSQRSTKKSNTTEKEPVTDAAIDSTKLDGFEKEKSAEAEAEADNKVEDLTSDENENRGGSFESSQSQTQSSSTGALDKTAPVVSEPPAATTPANTTYSSGIFAATVAGAAAMAASCATSANSVSPFQKTRRTMEKDTPESQREFIEISISANDSTEAAASSASPKNAAVLRNDMTNVMKLALLAQYQDLCQKYSPEEARKIFLTILGYKQSQYQQAMTQETAKGNQDAVDPYKWVLVLIDDVTESLHKESQEKSKTGAASDGDANANEDEKASEPTAPISDFVSAKEAETKEFAKECETNKIIFDKYQNLRQKQTQDQGPSSSSKTTQSCPKKTRKQTNDASTNVSTNNANANATKMIRKSFSKSSETENTSYATETSSYSYTTKSEDVDTEIDKFVDLIANTAMGMIFIGGGGGVTSAVTESKATTATTDNAKSFSAVAADEATAMYGKCATHLEGAKEGLEHAMAQCQGVGAGAGAGAAAASIMCAPLSWMTNVFALGIVSPAKDCVMYTGTEASETWLECTRGGGGGGGGGNVSDKHAREVERIKAKARGAIETMTACSASISMDDASKVSSANSGGTAPTTSSNKSDQASKASSAKSGGGTAPAMTSSSKSGDQGSSNESNASNVPQPLESGEEKVYNDSFPFTNEGGEQATTTAAADNSTAAPAPATSDKAAERSVSKQSSVVTQKGLRRKVVTKKNKFNAGMCVTIALRQWIQFERSSRLSPRHLISWIIFLFLSTSLRTHSLTVCFVLFCFVLYDVIQFSLRNVLQQTIPRKCRRSPRKRR